MEVKEYTREEFAKSLLELHEGDPAALAKLVLQVNPWIKNCLVVAEYRNGMLSPNSYFDRRYLAYEPFKEIPMEIADSQGLSARYRLEAVYKLNSMGLHPDAVLDLPAMLGELKIPRPAVAYIKTTSDENGAPRQGWAVYREQELVELVWDIGGEFEHRLKELGADKEWATGTIDVCEEMWAEITNEDNWPVSSQKFSSHRAERLYGYTLESGQDDEVGDSDWGGYALFADERTILHMSPQGFVSAEVFDNEDSMRREWDSLSEAWDAYNDEGEEDE